MPKQASQNTSPIQTGSNSSALGSPPPTLSRPFRSRKNRPCDACRRAKTRCAIPEIGPPCVECQQTRKQCTFDELPPERKKPQKPTLSPIDYDLRPPFSSGSPKFTPTTEKNSGLEALVVAASEERQLRMRGEPASLDLNTAEHLSPHVITTLVTDDLLPIGSKRTGPESTLPSCSTPYIRQVSYDTSKPQYVVFNHRPNKPSAPQLGEGRLKILRASYGMLHPPPDETQLIHLYFDACNCALPLVLPPSDAHPLDSAMISRVCLTALSHAPEYRESVKAIQHILSSSTSPDIGDGRLSNVAVALLDISSRPVIDAETNYITLAKTIAQAQLLGLHIDPMNWAIPSWEKDYRRILWWTLRTHDAWMSFLNSRPSHIQSSNNNVSFPTFASVLSISAPSVLSSPEAKTPILATPSSLAAQSFVFTCRLSILVTHLQSQVFTLAASMETSREDRLARVVQIEADAANLLNEVRTCSPSGIEERPASGFGSLMVSLLGFRCMLRRIYIELCIGLGSPFSPDSETLEMYASAVDYVCTLDPSSYNGFWLNHVGHILSSMTSSLIRLSCATSVTMQAKTSQTIQIQTSSPNNPMHLLCRLRNSLFRARHEHHWDLAQPALTRADKVAACFREGGVGGDLIGVIAALEGRYIVGGEASSSSSTHPVHQPNGRHPPQPPPPPQQPPTQIALGGPGQPSAANMEAPPLQPQSQSPSAGSQAGGYIDQNMAMNIDFSAFGMTWQGHGLNLSPGEWDFRSPSANHGGHHPRNGHGHGHGHGHGGPVVNGTYMAG